MLLLIKDILVLNPFLGIHIALIVQTIILIITTIFPTEPVYESPLIRNLFYIIKALFMALSMIFALMLIDMAFTWNIGSWTYNDWRFQLPSVVLILLISIEILGYLLLFRPHVIITLYVATSYFIYAWFLHIYVAQFDVMSPFIKEDFLPLLGFLFLPAIPIFYWRLKKEPLSPDAAPSFILKMQSYYKRIYTKKTHWGLWLLTLLQSILTLNGYSLFFSLLA